MPPHSLKELEGGQYLARLARAAETIINAEDYGRVIHDLAMKRGLIQTGEDDYAGLLCEPRWVEEVGENLYVVGVSFPSGQEGLSDLKRSLLSEND